EAEIAWTALIRGRYGKQVRVSQLRVDEMLERLKANLDKPQYRIAEIFLFAPDQESRNNAKSRAETLIGEINRGANFDEVARQFSAAPSASQGGDLSWMSPGDMRPEVWAAVQGAPNPPTLLPPIESEGGVYVIALLGKREPAGPGSVVLDLVQVVARGDGAAEKLAQIKGKATDCRGVPAAITGIEGVTSETMNDIALEQVADAFRPALEKTQAGQSTDVIDLQENAGKMVFYVCERASGTPGLPSRDEIYDRLFNQELGMVAERYLRDLKREASIDRR
ncbi:MAG TPA: peptidylprolyl isomerase, partial [Hyphomonadaceae bacterium]|nr:peptidylprolyl isomerase [Hyphomonadaceae bacterium]